jgi:hypothetical protein
VIGRTIAIRAATMQPDVSQQRNTAGARRFHAVSRSAMHEVIAQVRDVVTETHEQVMDPEIDLVSGERYQGSEHVAPTAVGDTLTCTVDKLHG